MVGIWLCSCYDESYSDYFEFPSFDAPFRIIGLRSIAYLKLFKERPNELSLLDIILGLKMHSASSFSKSFLTCSSALISFFYFTALLLAYKCSTTSSGLSYATYFLRLISANSFVFLLIVGPAFWGVSIRALYIPSNPTLFTYRLLKWTKSFCIPASVTLSIPFTSSITATPRNACFFYSQLIVKSDWRFTPLIIRRIFSKFCFVTPYLKSPSSKFQRSLRRRKSSLSSAISVCKNPKEVKMDPKNKNGIGCSSLHFSSAAMLFITLLKSLSNFYCKYLSFYRGSCFKTAYLFNCSIRTADLDWLRMCKLNSASVTGTPLCYGSSVITFISFGTVSTILASLSNTGSLTLF